MSTGTLAKRYARAIFDLAQEANEIEQVGKDLSDLSRMWKSSDELQELFRNPGFSAEARKQVLVDLASQAQVCATVKSSLLYLNDNGRIAALPLVVSHYERIAETAAGAVRAEVVTATPLSDAYYETLRTALEQATGKKVSLDRRTDPALIGGVVTRVGSQVFDGSVRTRLNELKDSLRSA